MPWLASALHTDAPGSVANKTNFDDPKFAELFHAALSEPDLARRSRLVHQAQAIQHESGGILLWGFTNTLDGIGPRVGGAKAEQTLFPTWRFENLWV